MIHSIVSPSNDIWAKAGAAKAIAVPAAKASAIRRVTQSSLMTKISIKSVRGYEKRLTRLKRLPAAPRIFSAPGDFAAQLLEA
jgi:hypothetical protein